MRIVKLLLLTSGIVSSAGAGSVRITLLATTDLHGNLYPYDFYTGKPAPRGLAKEATLIRQVRSESPNTVLIDCGDTIQGAPLESVYQHYVANGKLPLGLPLAAPLAGDPMMRAMNALHYDAMVLGNHEFNFGLKNLNRARANADFPWLSANTRVERGAASRPFPAYIVKSVGGVRVAVVGVTTPKIPMWEERAHYRGYRFISPKTAVEQAIAELKAREHPDLVIVAAHAGLGRNLKSGAAESAEVAGENSMYAVAAGVPGIDAMIIGHTHQQIASARVGDVLVMQPKNWGVSLGRMDFRLEQSGSGWKVVEKSSRLIPVTEHTPVDESLTRMAQPYFDAAERYLNSPVAQAPQALSSKQCRVQDTALVDAIQKVQVIYAKANVSFAACFNANVKVPKGPVTVREIAALYLYDNTLYAIQGNGKMVREALENAARYYLPCSGGCSSGPLLNRRIPGFNYDMAEGVEYEIDVSQPVGHRIRNLRFKGKPLRDDTPLRIAVNNYRAGGSGGYTMFRDARVLWRSRDDIRAMIIDYYTRQGRLPAHADHNWSVAPVQARHQLEREAALAAAGTQ
jgi:2',3'-cyclic-nucleotide 2'-phosphodiesterase/3'-nucleotidase